MATAVTAAGFCLWWTKTRTPCSTSTSARTCRAKNGAGGAGGNRDGANGGDLVLKVPSGTVVQTMAGEVIADLVGVGTTLEVARGGRGGRGNAALASSRRKAPGFAELGEPGERLDVVLELKSVADVGLVGFPSAGKSSLISVISAAKPKIADYPFTTLVPNLGVVQAGEQVFTVADVPGLIPGAATGKGLGLQFLRHIERCAVLAHVVDTATLEPGRDPAADIDALEAELAAYGGLEDKPRIIVLNKIDVPDGRDLADIVEPDLAQVRLAHLSGQRRHPGRLAGVHLRPRPSGRRASRGPAGAGADPAGAATVGCGRFRVHGGTRRRRRVGGQGRQAGALGAPDQLRQRRGRRLPGRPAGPPWAWRTNWPSWVPSRATRCASAPWSSTGSPPSRPSSFPPPAEPIFAWRTTIRGCRPRSGLKLRKERRVRSEGDTEGDWVEGE